MTGAQVVGLAAIFVIMVVVAMVLSPTYGAAPAIAGILIVATCVGLVGAGIVRELRTGFIRGRFLFGPTREVFRSETPRLFWCLFACTSAITLPFIGFGVWIVFYKLVEFLD